MVPERRNGHEILDDPKISTRILRRSMRDVRKSNRLFGGTRAVISEMVDALATVTHRASLLDVGTGLGDIPARVQRMAHRRHITLRTLGVDRCETLLDIARRRVDDPVCANALILPFADHSIDIVCCSQVLHHFHGAQALWMLREMDRVARVRVIVADLRRSWVAIAGLWAASFPLAFHPVSRHDGIVSILRGFTPQELNDLVGEAIGQRPRIRTHPMFRVTASWQPLGA